jgi:hypothetical protein
MPALPASMVPILLPFAPLFTAPIWRPVQVLLRGTLLAQGPRTVTAALRAMGLANAPRFEKDRRVLSRGCRSGLREAPILLGLLVPCLPPNWPIVVAVDATLERRKGAQIAAKGRSREAVRSSQSQVVTGLAIAR